MIVGGALWRKSGVGVGVGVDIYIHIYMYTKRLPVG